MKLIALQHISDQLPPGATFDIPDDDRASGETLILAGLAKEDDSVPESSDPSSTRRRTYRRRDLTAEP